MGYRLPQREEPRCATASGTAYASTLLVVSTSGRTAWGAAVTTVVAAVGFVVRERSARHPLLDLRLVARPLVASGLAYKAAAGLAMAGLSYMVTLQLQLAWGWLPALAAVGTLPQVVVLLASGRLVGPFVRRVGLDRAAWTSATAVVAGLAVFATLGRFGYPWVLIALVLVAAGMRVVGVVAGTTVLRGLPADRTSVGAALVDTASELATAVGISATGTILAALVSVSITTTSWTPAQSNSFQAAISVAGLTLTAVAAALVGLGALRARRTTPSTTPITQEPSDV